MARKNKSSKPKESKDTLTYEHNLYQKALAPKIHQPGASRCYILDGMNLAYQAYHAYKSLTHKGKSVSIRFGLPQIIRSLIMTHHPAKLIVVWDGYKHPKRLELLPNYKGHRDAKRDPIQRAAFLKEIDSVRILLHRMGLTQVYDQSIEGDDMIYLVAKKMKATHPITIVSGDKDFHQLIDQDTMVLNPRSKFSSSIETFGINHGCLLTQFVDYLCLVGDDSDDIPGVRGIGPVRAGLFLRAHGSIKSYLESDSEFSGLIDKDNLKKVYRINRHMIDLKLFNRKYNKGVKVTYFKGKSNPEFQEGKFIAYCMKYNLRTMMSDNFKKPFKS